MAQLYLRTSCQSKVWGTDATKVYPDSIVASRDPVVSNGVSGAVSNGNQEEYALSNGKDEKTFLDVIFAANASQTYSIVCHTRCPVRRTLISLSRGQVQVDAHATVWDTDGS